MSVAGRHETPRPGRIGIRRAATIGLRRLAPLTLVGFLGCFQTEQEIRIGVIAPFTSGFAASVATPARHAAEMAEKVISENGGLTVGGVRARIRLVYADNQDNPERAVAMARQLINRDGVVALVGPYLSRSAIRVATVAENERVPMVTPIASHPDVTRGRTFAFRLSFTDPDQGNVMARFARRNLGSQSAAVLFEVTNHHTQSLAQLFRDEFARLGGRVVGFESYASGQRDFSAVLGTFTSAAPDVLFLPNYTDDLPRQITQAREAGFRGTLLGSDGWNGNDLGGIPGVDGSFFAEPWHHDLDSEATRAFVVDYRSLHGATPPATAALTYDAVLLLANAIERAGSGVPDSIRAALSTTRAFAGVTGVTTFRSTGDPMRDVLVLRFEDGQPVVHRSISP